MRLTPAFAFCDAGGCISDSSSDTLTPPVTRTYGVGAKVTDGSTVSRVRYGSGMVGSAARGDRGGRWWAGRVGGGRVGGSREQRRVAPRVVESRDLDAGAEPIGREFPALKCN